MNQWKVNILLLFCVSAALFLLCCKTEADEKLVFSAGAPLNGYQARVIVPVLKEAFKRNNIRFEAVYYPSLRSLLYSDKGVVDGELHRVYEFHKVSNGKYPNLVRIDSKMLTIWIAAFSSKKLKIRSYKDLKNYIVIYYRGRKNVESFLRNSVPDKMIIKTTTDSEAFKMLHNGIGDIVLSESRQGKKIIRNNSDYSDISEIAKLSKTEIYSFINKKHVALAPVIEKTVNSMKKDGTFKKIVERVNLSFR